MAQDPNKMPCRISDDSYSDYSDWFDGTGVYERDEPDPDSYDDWWPPQSELNVDLEPLIRDDAYPTKKLDASAPPSAFFKTVALMSKVYINSHKQED